MKPKAPKAAAPSVAPGDFLPSPQKARADAMAALADRMDALSSGMDAGTTTRPEAARELREIASALAHRSRAAALADAAAKLDAGERMALAIVVLDEIEKQVRDGVRWELMDAPRVPGPDQVTKGHPMFPKAPNRYFE